MGLDLVETLVEDRFGYIPCSQFNQTNTCSSQDFVHSENRIHSCALCFYSLNGLINIHYLSKCPLLSYLE